jgi:hypothetical protein
MRLKGIALAATGGEWSFEPHSNGGHTLFAGRNAVFPGSEDCPFPMTMHGLNLLNVSDLDWNGKQNMEFIAALSPSIVLQLIQLLEDVAIEG